MAFRIVTALGVLLPFLIARMKVGLATPWWAVFILALVAFGLGRAVEACMRRKPSRDTLGWLLLGGGMLASFGYAFWLIREMQP